MTQTKAPPAVAALKAISTKGRGLPNRYVIHGVEGVGKTSLATMFPGVVVLQSKGETGLDTLLTYGRVKDTPHLPECETWDDARAQVKALLTEDHQLKAVALDAMNGFESLLHHMVCNRDFNGDWGEKGFLAYGRGVKTSIPEWQELLADLDKLRTERGMTVVLVSHTAVKGFRNPTGDDYDRYTPAVAPETWSITHKWADLVMFLNWEVFVEGATDRKRGKGTGKARMMYTERDAAYDAKNRHGLPPEIEMGNSAAEAWASFSKAFKAGRG